MCYQAMGTFCGGHFVFTTTTYHRMKIVKWIVLFAIMWLHGASTKSINAIRGPYLRRVVSQSTRSLKSAANIQLRGGNSENQTVKNETQNEQKQTNENKTNDVLELELINATLEEDLVTVKEKLKIGANPNYPDSHGTSSLLYAAMLGNVEIFQWLANYGGILTSKASDGSTALHLTSYYGQMDLVAYLLENCSGALDVNAKDNDGSTPLHNAAYKGRCDCASLLIKHGADINERQSVNGYSALHLAVENGHEDMVDLLLQAGARPTARSLAGDVPSDLAAAGGRWAILERLARPPYWPSGEAGRWVARVHDVARLAWLAVLHRVRPSST